MTEINQSGKEGTASAIAKALELNEFSYNSVRNHVVVNGEPLDDTIFSQLYFDLINQGFKNRNIVETVITNIASQKEFHPIKQYFNFRVWDRDEHIKKLASCIHDMDGLSYSILRKWLIGAVAKVMSDGQTQNPMMVLSGAQRTGKSHLVAWLGSPLKEYFVEGPIQPDNKDCNIRLTESFIWEVAELGSTTRRQDIEALKHFLTMKTVTVRRPYGKFDLRKPALASFIGTVNDDGVGFLSDVTGHRRFRGLRIHDIGWKYTEIDVNQVWAEAVSAYENGESVDLSLEDSQKASEIVSEHFQEKNAIDDYINLCFIKADDKSFVGTTEILSALYSSGYRGRNSKVDSSELTKAMKRLGFEKHRTPGARGYKGIRPKNDHHVK